MVKTLSSGHLREMISRRWLTLTPNAAGSTPACVLMDGGIISGVSWVGSSTPFIFCWIRCMDSANCSGFSFPDPVMSHRVLMEEKRKEAAFNFTGPQREERRRNFEPCFCHGNSVRVLTRPSAVAFHIYFDDLELYADFLLCEDAVSRTRPKNDEYTHNTQTHPHSHNTTSYSTYTLKKINAQSLYLIR